MNDQKTRHNNGRRRRHSIPLEHRPAEVQEAIKRLREEAKGYRLRLRYTEAELAEARLRIASLMLDNADLRQGILPAAEVV